MQTALIVTGTLSDSRTVTLDEPLHAAGSRVRLVVEPLPVGSPPTYHEVMNAIRERQRVRGHWPRTREAVDADLQAERDSWGD